MGNSLYNYFFGYETRRKRLLKKVPSEPLKDYLSGPFPDPDTPLNEVPILAMDF
jgi:DNA polymerase III subunit epsilon